MFWGLIMEPNKRYTQTVEKAFHLSMASLDASTASVGLVQVMICYDNRNYLLCTLQKGQIWQVPLDLNFQEGTKIAFTCNGDGHVHLTGYLIPEDGLDELDDFDDEEEEEEEEIPQLVDLKKRKQNSNLIENLKKAKKSKMEIEEDDDESDDDEDELGNDDDSDDSDDDLDVEEDEEDDEDEDDSDDEDQEQQEPVNDSKKQKQKQKQAQQVQQAQQNQQNHQAQNKQQNKKDKSQLVNGKDAKPGKEQGKQKKNKDDSKSDSEQQKKKTVEGGVQVEDIKVGSGAPAKAGKFVSVYYVGRLKNGKKFDQTNQGEGFKFRLGKGEVIKGWDIGIAGMKVGGKRRINIPPNMAYGAKGSPPVIPPNSALNFEVELKAVH